MDSFLSILASPLPFIILISVVITVHELGHYWAGRLFGAAAESFSIGFGSPIVEVKDKRGTKWRISWLPIGGYVKFVGEMQAPTDDTTSEPSGLVGKPLPSLGPLKRFIIAIGGPLANFVFAVVVFAGIGMGLGTAVAKEVRVVRVEASSPAEQAGFLVGDVVTKAGGRRVLTHNDVTRATFLSSGENVSYEVLREGQPLTLTAIPVEREEHNEAFKVTEKIGRVGLVFENSGLAIRKLNPVEAVGFGFSATGDALSNTVNVLRRLVTGRDGFDKMSGPVGIFRLADSVTDSHMKQEGLPFGEKLRRVTLQLLELSALLSIGIGFFNLLPLPILDGGTALMCIAEAVTGRGIPERVQRIGLTIGFACLVSFFLVVTWQDVNKLPWWPGGGS